MHHATLKIHGIPVFYFPVHGTSGRQPWPKERLPDSGRSAQSTTRGTILGDGFYWVISRNADATMGAAIYTARGWAQFGDLRASASATAFQAQYYGVMDNKGTPQGRTRPEPGRRRAQGQRVQATAAMDFRGSSTSTFCLRTFSAWHLPRALPKPSTPRCVPRIPDTKTGTATASESLARAIRTMRATTPGDYIQIVHAPSLEFSTAERPFSRTNFVYAYDVAARRGLAQ